MKKFKHINKTSSKNWNKNTLPRTLGFEVWRTKNTSYNAKNLSSPNPSIPKSNTYFTLWVSHNAKNQPNHLKSTIHRAKSKSHSYPFHHRETQDSNPNIGSPDHPKLGVTTHDFSEVITSKTSSPRPKMMEARNPLPLSRSHLTKVRFRSHLTEHRVRAHPWVLQVQPRAAEHRVWASFLWCGKWWETRGLGFVGDRF